MDAPKDKLAAGEGSLVKQKLKSTEDEEKEEQKEKTQDVDEDEGEEEDDEDSGDDDEDDSDEDDDDEDDSSYDGQESEASSDEEDAGGRKSKRAQKDGAAKEDGGLADAVDFGIDEDEVKALREAAVEMYGEAVLGEGGADGVYTSGLGKEEVNSLWRQMLEEAKLPVSMRALEQQQQQSSSASAATLDGSGGAGGTDDADVQPPAAKRARPSSSDPSSLGHIDDILYRANRSTVPGEARESSDSARAVLERVSALGLPLDVGGPGSSVISGRLLAPQATSATATTGPAEASRVHKENGRAIAAALREQLAASPSPSFSSSSSSSASPSTPPPYFVACSTRDVLDRKRKRDGERVKASGLGLWMPVASSSRGLAGLIDSACKREEEDNLAAEGASSSSTALAASSSVSSSSATGKTEDAELEDPSIALQRLHYSSSEHGSLAATDPALAQRLLTAAASAKATLAGRKVAVKQTVKFAGQTITVTRLVDAGTEAEKAAKAKVDAARLKAQQAQQQAADAAAAAGGRAPLSGMVPGGFGGGGAAGGLGGILASLDRTEAISTLAKSSLDWDQYKLQKGIEDELAGAAKEGVGFVGKQAFLARVDARQDEQAAAKRATERAARFAAQAAAAQRGGGGF